MYIRKYNKILDEAQLMKMIQEEDSWDYADEGLAAQYKNQERHPSSNYIYIRKQALKSMISNTDFFLTNILNPYMRMVYN